MAAFVSSAYLDEFSSKIRSKPVPWEGYQRAGLVTSDELAQIKRVDRQPRAKIESILVTDGQPYALLYLNLLRKLARVDTMQYVLVLIGDALSDHDERIPLFTQLSTVDPDLPYGPILKTLETQDEFIQLKASSILSALLSAGPGPLPPNALGPFLTTLSHLIASSSPHARSVSVQCLSSLLTRTEVRRAVWRNPPIVQGLVDILQSKPIPQTTYEVGFCFWLLSFDPAIAEELNKKFGVIPLLTSIAQNAVKEKVIRVIVATFRNLVGKAPKSNLPVMLVVKLLPFVNNLATRKWTDEEIVEDIQYLQEELKANFKSLTTYDEYTSELSSGQLSWSPVHDSDEFWRENAIKLNDKEFEQIKTLISLLKTSTEPLVLAVAAHDIGKYVKHCDRGKKVVTDLGGKTRVMELMSHENADVRYQALLSVQRLVSQPWVS